MYRAQGRTGIPRFHRACPYENREQARLSRIDSRSPIMSRTGFAGMTGNKKPVQ